jgi:hypothetical protein
VKHQWDEQLHRIAARLLSIVASTPGATIDEAAASIGYDDKPAIRIALATLNESFIARGDSLTSAERRADAEARLRVALRNT